jgi:hypothetical protein
VFYLRATFYGMRTMRSQSNLAGNTQMNMIENEELKDETRQSASARRPWVAPVLTLEDTENTWGTPKSGAVGEVTMILGIVS